VAGKSYNIFGLIVLIKTLQKGEKVKSVAALTITLVNWIRVDP